MIDAESCEDDCPNREDVLGRPAVLGGGYPSYLLFIKIAPSNAPDDAQACVCREFYKQAERSVSSLVVLILAVVLLVSAIVSIGVIDSALSSICCNDAILQQLSLPMRKWVFQIKTHHRTPRSDWSASAWATNRVLARSRGAKERQEL